MSAYARVLAAHQRIYQATRGWLGHRLIGAPTLLLTTRGRRTGLARTVALVYARDGDDLLVVASNGGRDRPPSWLLNVESAPRAQVQIGRRHHRVSSRPTYPGDPEYDRLLVLCDRANRGRYSRYRSQTARPIPIVALTPLPTRRAPGSRRRSLPGPDGPHEHGAH